MKERKSDMTRNRISSTKGNTLWRVGVDSSEDNTKNYDYNINNKRFSRKGKWVIRKVIGGQVETTKIVVKIKCLNDKY